MDAALKNASLMGYKVPTAADVPPIEVILLEHPDPNGPYGAKSAGEVGITPPAGAIANAVADALGVRVYEAPLAPERILAAWKPGVESLGERLVPEGGRPS